jgi:hypothetical protein
LKKVKEDSHNKKAGDVAAPAFLPFRAFYTLSHPVVHFGANFCPVLLSFVVTCSV